MKIGICVAPEQLELVTSLGYDFLELPLNAIAGMHDDAFDQLKQTLAGLDIPASHFNLFLPQGLPVLGPDVSDTELTMYAEKALSRAASIGGKVAVFGSGGARRLPDGITAEAGREQLKHACLLFADIAAAHGILLVMEPLNHKETDLVNTVSEGFQLVTELSHPALQLLADYFHMYMENESLDILSESAPVLRHCHIAIGKDRHFPAMDDIQEVRGFLNALEDAGYTGAISVEGVPHSFQEDAAESIHLLRLLNEQPKYLLGGINMKYCMCSTWAKQHPVEHVLTIAKNLALDGVELWSGHVDEFLSRGNSLEDLKKLLESYGLECVVIAPYLNLIDASVQAENLAIARKCIYQAQALGVPMVRAFLGDKASNEVTKAEWQCCTDALRILTAEALQVNVKIALEIHNDQPTDTVHSTLRVLRLVDSPALGLIFDGFNFYPSGYEMIDALEPLKKYIIHYHFKNLKWSPHVCVPLDEGDADFAPLIHAIKKDGYDGYISFEYFAADPSDMIRSSKEWFLKTYNETID